MTYPPFHPLGGDYPSSMALNEFKTVFPSESQYVEWKEKIDRQKIRNAIVAFSNADGGIVMVGVNDDGEPTQTGSPLDEKTRKDLRETITAINSHGQCELIPLSVGEVEITIISVERRHQGVAQTPGGTSVVRRGKQNLPLIGEELFSLMSMRHQDAFDASPSRWSLAVADPGLLSNLCQASDITQGLSEQDLADALEERGLVTRQGGKALLTKAGALFLVPDAPRELGKCYIEIFRRLDDSGEYDLRKEFGGTPSQQAENAIAWIDEQLGFDLVIVGAKRHELKRLPNKALREVVANAVAHRDYQLSGSSIEVHLRPHGVEVTSPGGFVAPVTSENIRDAHAARNRTVIRTLRAFDLGEDAGRGIKVILEEMASDLRGKPTFQEEVGGFVTVRLPIESPVTPEERAWIQALEDQDRLSPDDRRVLIEAARGELLANATVSSLLNVDSTHARQSLQRLRDAGFLEQVGQRGGARYRIAQTIQRPVGVDLSRDELRSVILDIASQHPVTNAMLQKHLGLPRYGVRDLLTELVHDELLESRGAGRGAYYVAPNYLIPLDFKDPPESDSE